MNLFTVPYDFIDYTNVTDSRSIGVCLPFELLDVVIFGGDRVFTEGYEQLDDPSSVTLRQLLYSLSSSRSSEDLKQLASA